MIRKYWTFTELYFDKIYIEKNDYDDFVRWFAKYEDRFELCGFYDLEMELYELSCCEREDI